MDKKEKIAKAYLKNKTFYNLGFNLLAYGATGLSLKHYVPDNGVWIIALCVPILLTVAGNGLGKIPVKIFNKYINFKKSYALDDKLTFNQQPEQVESIIKQTLLLLFAQKNDAFVDVLKSKDDEEHKKITHIDKWYWLESLSNDALKSTHYDAIFKHIYQNFEQDGLLGYYIGQNSVKEFSFLAKSMKGVFKWTEEDIKAIKSTNDTIDRDIVKYLLQRDIYMTMPKAIRTHLVNYGNKEFIQEQRSNIIGYEKEIEALTKEPSVLSDIEKIKAKDNLKKIQHSIKEKTVPIQTKQEQPDMIHQVMNSFCETSPNLATLFSDTLSEILDKSHHVSGQLAQLPTEASIEFKNLIEVMLPKYLHIVSHGKLDSHKQEEFKNTLNLVNNFLDKCLVAIEDSQINNFDTYNLFFKNKLTQYSMSGDDNNEKNISKNHQKSLKNSL